MSTSLRPLIALIVFLLSLADTLPARCERETRVLVLRGSRPAGVDSVTAGFRHHLSRSGVAFVEEVMPAPFDASTAARARLFGPDIVLALGNDAVEFGTDELDEMPVVGALFTSLAVNRAPNLTGVFMEISPDTQFSWFRRLLPRQRRVGVVYNPAQNEAVVANLRKAARGAGLELITRSITTPGEITSALERITQEADVLWAIPDQTFLTPQTVESVVLYTIRNRVPLVGMSSPWVQAGAIYALERDYPDVGEQCGELAVQVLKGARPADLGLYYPRTVVYSVNEYTARIMKVALGPGAIANASEVIR